MEWKTDEEVMTHFFSSASMVANSDHFWTTLNALGLTEFTFSYIEAASLVFKFPNFLIFRKR